MPFLDQYRAVRHADGHGARTTDEYRALPAARAGDRNATEWRIRRESFEAICRCAGLDGQQADSAKGGSRRLSAVGVASPSCARATRVLDVGAGNGWLSHRLSRLGHEPVALDLNDDTHDGLLACRNYEIPFPLVQADFEELPFVPRQFDVVVMNASLHYAREPRKTLESMSRMVTARGALIVMDSPLFEDPEDGEAMVARQLEHLRDDYAVSSPIRAGAGFLTFADLAESAARLRRRACFYPSRGPLGWRVRRLWSRRRLGRAPAAFGVWVAR